MLTNLRESLKELHGVLGHNQQTSEESREEDVFFSDGFLSLSILKVSLRYSPLFTFIGGRRNTDVTLDAVVVVLHCGESVRLWEHPITELDGIDDHDKCGRPVKSTT